MKGYSVTWLVSCGGERVKSRGGGRHLPQGIIKFEQTGTLEMLPGTGQEGKLGQQAKIPN